MPSINGLSLTLRVESEATKMKKINSIEDIGPYDKVYFIAILKHISECEAELIKWIKVKFKLSKAKCEKLVDLGSQLDLLTIEIYPHDSSEILVAITDKGREFLENEK